MKHMVLHKKIEELEADVDSILQSTVELPPGQFISDDDCNNKKIDRVCRKINFVTKLLADVTGTYSQDRLEELGEMADRLSVVENNFTEWTARQAEDEQIDDPMSPFSCISSFLDEDGEEDQEAGDEEKDDTEQCSIVVADYPEYILSDGVDSKTAISNASDEKIRWQALLSRVNLEDLILKLAEKENSNMRRQGKLFRIFGTMGVAVLAIGLVVAWFGSVEEEVYLVPT